MPTIALARFGPDFDGVPARLAREELEIWERWWPLVREGTINLWFDVGLGPGKPVPKGVSAEMAFMWLRNTQKRADVILEKEDSVWIVEIRFAAQSSALGRLRTYKRLWDLDPLVRKPVRLLLVTNFLDEDVKGTADELGIDYQVV